MAFRKIHESFWTDPDIEELTPEQKYFYLYLITNPRNNQIGLFEFSINRAVFETGYNRDTVEKLLQHFEEEGKIVRSKKSKEIVICKFWHYNKSNSPKVLAHVEELKSKVKDTVLIQYIYSMHTLSQEEEEKEEEKEKEEVQVQEKDLLRQRAEWFIDYWNEKNGTRNRLTDKAITQVKSRMKSFTPQELIDAIDNRSKSEYLKESGHIGNWDSFWRSDSQVDKWLNHKPQSKSIYDIDGEELPF